MALGLGGQFLLLLGKEFLLARRKPCSLVFQFVLPLAFAAFLVVLRLLVENDTKAEKVYEPLFLDPPPNRTVYEILYSPNTAKATEIMNNVHTKLGGSPYTVQGFANDAALESYREINTATVWAGVVFDTSSNDYSTTIPKQVHYQLRVARLNPEDSWQTANTFPFFRTPGARDDTNEGGTPNYYLTGFLTLQYLVGRAIINIQSSTTTLDNLNFNMKKMAYQSYIKDNLLSVLQIWLPFFVMLSFIITALQTTKGVTYEKEKRLKESMKLMGMSEAVYWCAVFTKAMFFLLIASAFYLLCLFVSVGENGRVFNASDPSLILVFFIVYDVSLITFCIMVSTFFNKANTASYAGGLLYFGFFFPWFFINSEYETMTQGQKFASCLPFNTAMAMGFNIIGIHEGTGEGAQWNNFHKAPSVDDNFSLGGVMLVLILDIFFHLLITWYVGNVFPGEFGIPRPFYFPFTPSYWGCCDKTERNFDPDLRHDTRNPKFFERDPPELRAGIVIEKLRKEYGFGKNKKVAVEGTSMNIYDGQITALLGHNGAGKTTTMSMLTGFLAPSSGTAKVNGYDIMTDIDKVRQSIGLCPQHDILFETMTVKEHLRYFCKLKGTPPKDIEGKVTEMIKILGMEEKTNYAAGNLSGGQKRKLSVGIAIIGDSKIIILDEPTSGMDPGARRQTWDILKKFKDNRTMILSTHFMDEADLLGDRIAIMAEGVVKCCGTSLFLKKAFGAGYHLVMVKGQSCDVYKVTELVQSHVPTARLESEISAELSYLLPFDQSRSFAGLFSDVEEKKSSLGIQSFGTTATTMEEVFLKVGESGKEDVEEEIERLNAQAHTIAQSPVKVHAVNGAFEKENGASGKENGDFVEMRDVKNGDVKKDSNLSKYTDFNKQIVKNKGMALTFQQFKSMIIKKAIHSWRNRIVTFVQLALPVIFTILALLIEANATEFAEEPALNLNLAKFENPVALYDNPANTIAAKYKDLFATKEDTSSASSFDRYVIDKMKQVGMSSFSKRYIVGLHDDNTANTTTYFNGDPYHSPGIALAFTMDAILKAYKSDTTYGITTDNFPFKRDLEGNSNRAAGTAGSGFSIAFVILFGVAFLTTSFILFLIKERNSGAKHLQKVSGLSSVTYWSANFVWDYINYLIPAVLMVVVFAAYRPDAYFLGEPSRISLIFLVYILFGWASLPYTYVLHYLFKTPATGMVTITMSNILTGLATTLTVFMLMFPTFGTQDIALVLDWIFAIVFPHYNLGASIMNIYTNYQYINTCERSMYQVTCQIPALSTGSCCMGNCGTRCLRFVLDYLSMTYPGIGKYVLMMAIQGLVYLLLVTMAELNFFYWVMYRLRGKSGRTATVDSEQEDILEEDDDVVNERKRINNNEIDSFQGKDALILKNLSKYYGNFQAVKGVSIGVPRQECFGLLGQNGAGKTTTFKMMTGDEIVTGGNAYLNNYDVKNHIKEVQQNLGYCPQFDALIDQMTGEEILFMFARLRGVQEQFIDRVASELIKVLMLEKYAKRQCGTYSGGNKRKLSTAISLIGDPPFIFLDEPTTGMDPGARRQLWNVLSQVRESGRTLILTSHSMEECDALCTRLVIMVNGQFVCLGSPQHLKDKFGNGYTLIVRLSAENSDSAKVKNFITEKFPDSQVFDDHHDYLHFRIPNTSVSLSSVFGAMEEASERLGIEDYSVHQTTLEQVFLSFTNKQNHPAEKKKPKGCCGLCTCCSLCACTCCCGD